MKNSFMIKIWAFLFALVVSADLLAQTTIIVPSTNKIDYQITYTASTQTYSVYVVPRYSTPNANNTSANELGATAQVTLAVPDGFVITSLTSVTGSWSGETFQYGPGEPLQDWSATSLASSTLDYYSIGKGTDETNYGPFVSGTPVLLFTFKGNGCYGPVSVIPPNDPVITQIANVPGLTGLNVANSFSSQSAGPQSGNNSFYEQFNQVAGAPANCSSISAIADNASTFTGTAVTTNVLANDTNQGATPTTTNTTVTAPGTSTNGGTVVVNANGTLTYTPPSGFTGTDTYTYTICDKIVTTSCSTTTVTVTVGCPFIAAPTSVTASPSTLCGPGTSTLNGVCSTGTLTWYSNAALTLSVSNPVTVSATTTYYGACVSGNCKSTATPMTVTVSSTLAAPTSVTASPSSLCGPGTSTLSGFCSSGVLTWYSDATLTLSVSNPVTVSTTTTYYGACVSGNCKSTATPMTVTVSSTLAAPTSVTASPSSLCGPGTSTLNGVCSSGVLTWYSDATLTLSVSNPVTVSATTTYYGACVSGNCKSTATPMTVTVSSTLAAPTSVTASPSSLCGPGTSTLNGVCSSGVLTWYSDATLTLSVSNPVTVSATTTYYGACVSGNCKSTATPMTITVSSTLAAPTSVTASPSSLCGPGTSTLSGFCSSGVLTWYSDATLTLSVSNPVTVSTTTTYYGACVSGNCKSPSTAVSVSVTPIPSAPTSASANPSSVCPNSTTTLSATCLTGSSPTWYLDAALTQATTSQPTVSIQTTYYVACVSTTNPSCKSPHSSVIVSVDNNLCQRDIRITKVINTTTANIGNNVTYTVTATNLSASTATSLTVNDVLDAGLTLVSATPSIGTWSNPTWTIPSLGGNQSATLTVVATVTREGVSINTATLTSSDNNTTNNTATACVSVPVQVCSGSSVTLTAPTGYTNVQWFLNGNLVGSGNTYQATQAGTYTTSASNSTCPAQGCCPVVVVSQVCCPANICVPITVTKN